MVAADLGRALLLFSVPLAAWRGGLHLEQLYLVQFLVGVLTVVFDVAYQSWLPSLIPSQHLVEGNSKLEMSDSVAQIAGPGLGGRADPGAYCPGCHPGGCTLLSRLGTLAGLDSLG